MARGESPDRGGQESVEYRIPLDVGILCTVYEWCGILSLMSPTVPLYSTSQCDRAAILFRPFVMNMQCH